MEIIKLSVEFLLILPLLFLGFGAKGSLIASNPHPQPQDIFHGRQETLEHYSLVQQQHAPVQQQFATVPQQHAPVQQKYLPVTQQHEPVLQQHSPLQQQLAPVEQHAPVHQQVPSQLKSPYPVPIHQEIHSAQQTKEHVKPHQDHPTVTQTQPLTLESVQIKYDQNGIPLFSAGSKGLVTEHGDRAAMYGEFPYKVQIRKNGEFVAGGTLVKSPITGKHVIITATHVIDEHKDILSFAKKNIFELRMGAVGLDSERGQGRKIKAILPHEDYIKLNTDSHRPIFNDISILIPDSDFVENEFAKPIDLPFSDNLVGPLAGNWVSVKGWGKGREAGHNGASSTLRVVEVPVWNNEKCRKTYWQESGKDIITDYHFCAGYENGGMDTCKGDSGGGAISTDRGTLYLAGIVSWGKGCGMPGYPGVYVKVTKYVDWIKQTLYNYEVRGIFPKSLRDIRY